MLYDYTIMLSGMHIALNKFINQWIISYSKFMRFIKYDFVPTGNIS